jgi:hypothetical protein
MLSFLKQKHPKKGFVYAITTGKFAGQLFVYVETKLNDHGFLSLPEMVTRSVPTDKFDMGVKNNIIDIVERLPSPVYKMCIKQYRKNQTLNK